MCLVDPIRQINLYGAAVAQNIRGEILQESSWAQVPAGYILVIQKLGMYGAVTATFGMYNGRSVVTEEGSILDATAFASWDLVPTVNIVVPGGSSLKCWMTDSAADPLGITFAVLGKLYKVSELRRR